MRPQAGTLIILIIKCQGKARNLFYISEKLVNILLTNIEIIEGSNNVYISAKVYNN